MFDFSGEFNKIYSSDASDLIGGIGQMKKARERRLAGDALANYAKVKSAELMAERGVYAAPQMQQQAPSRPSVGDQLWGLAGNALSGLVTSGVQGLFNKSYADTSTPALSSQFTNPATWQQSSQAVQGVMDGGFSWQQDAWQGQDPYSINMKSW